MFLLSIIKIQHFKKHLYIYCFCIKNYDFILYIYGTITKQKTYIKLIKKAKK